MIEPGREGMEGVQMDKLPDHQRKDVRERKPRPVYSTNASQERDPCSEPSQAESARLCSPSC